MLIKKAQFIFYFLIPVSFAAYEEDSPCEPLMLSSHKWAQNITFTPNSVFKVRCPLVDTQDHCGIVNLVEWLRSETRSGNRELVQTAYLIDPLTFYFENPSERDSGWYTCVVGNNAGVTELSTYIEFKGFGENNANSQPVRFSSTPPPPMEKRIPHFQSAPNPEEIESTTTIDDYLEYIQSKMRNNVYRQKNYQSEVKTGASSLPYPTEHKPIFRTTRAPITRPSFRPGQGNFNWNQKSSRYSPPEEDQISAAPSNIQAQFQSPTFENKKWNTGYKDEDLSGHLRYMYERMAKLENIIKNLQERVNMLEMKSHSNYVEIGSY